MPGAGVRRWGGSLAALPEQRKPPRGTLLTTAQREPPPSCFVHAALVIREVPVLLHLLPFPPLPSPLMTFPSTENTCTSQAYWTPWALDVREVRDLFFNGQLLGMQGLHSHLRMLQGRSAERCSGVQFLGCDFPLALMLLGGALSLWCSQLWSPTDSPGWQGVPTTRLPDAGGRRCAVPSPHGPFPSRHRGTNSSP